MNYQLKTVLEITAMMIRKEGWVSSGAARNNPSLRSTASYVSDHLEFDGKAKPSAADKRLAGKAVDWLHSESNPRGDYMRKIVELAENTTVTRRELGLACSIVGSYQRNQQWARENAERADNPGRHVGSVGDRLSTVVCIEGIREIDTRYGRRYLHNLRDRDGNALVIWGSRRFGSIGQSYRIRGTVKQHSEFRGQKQTTINRPHFGAEVAA